MTIEPVTYRLQDGVAAIRVDDGKANAMPEALLRRVDESFGWARRDKAVVVLFGRPGLFSAGFDLATLKQGRQATRAMVEAGVDLIRTVLRFPAPVLVVCEGHAYPMGAFLLLSADARIGVDGPWRIGLNEVAIGLSVPPFAVELARHRLSSAAQALVITGALCDPSAALHAGYFDRLVEPEALESSVASETARLKALDRTCFRRTKERVNAPLLSAIAAAGIPDLLEDRETWP